MINRRVLLSTLALLPALRSHTAAAQQTRRGGNLAFSFAVYGDSRSMMYLPYKSDQREEAIKLMVDMFEAAWVGRLSLAALALVRAAFGGSAGCLPALAHQASPRSRFGWCDLALALTGGVTPA